MFVCGRLPPECKVEATIQHVVGLPLAMLHDASSVLVTSAHPAEIVFDEMTSILIVTGSIGTL